MNVISLKHSDNCQSSSSIRLELFLFFFKLSIFFKSIWKALYYWNQNKSIMLSVWQNINYQKWTNCKSLLLPLYKDTSKKKRVYSTILHKNRIQKNPISFLSLSLL